MTRTARHPSPTPVKRKICSRLVASSYLSRTRVRKETLVGKNSQLTKCTRLLSSTPGSSILIETIAISLSNKRPKTVSNWFRSTTVSPSLTPLLSANMISPGCRLPKQKNPFLPKVWPISKLSILLLTYASSKRPWISAPSAYGTCVSQAPYCRWEHASLGSISLKLERFCADRTMMKRRLRCWNRQWLRVKNSKQQNWST